VNATLNTLGVVVEHILASSNSTGIYVLVPGFVVRDCTCQGNHYDGIYGSAGTGSLSGGTIVNCTLVANANAGMECYYGSVKDCQCLSNGVAGMFTDFSQVTGCRFFNCGSTNTASFGISVNSQCDISKCEVFACAGNGIHLINGACHISDCLVANCTGNGIYNPGGSSRIANCEVAYNGGIGIYAGPGTLVQNCQVSQSGSYGIEAYRSTVTDCVVSYCVLSGIYLNAPGCRISGNTCLGDNSSGNTSFNAGIFIDDANNRVENNHVTASGYAGIAINTFYAGNVVVKNTVQGNGGNNYLGTAGNDFGPIGTAATATSPWANISH